MVEKARNRFFFFLTLIILVFVFSFIWRYFEVAKEKDNFLSLLSQSSIVNKANYLAITRWHNPDSSLINVYSDNFLDKVLEKELGKGVNSLLKSS